MLKKKVYTKHENKKVNLLDTTISIKYIDADSNDDGRWIFGHTHFTGPICEIFISIKDEQGNRLPEKTVNCTLRHELYHAILGLLYFNERDNETLVEWLAQATNTLNEQGINI